MEFESNKALYARQAHLSQHQNDSDTLWQPHLASRWATGVDASSSHGSNHGDPPAFAAGPVPDGTGGERRRDGQQSQVRHRFASPFAQLHDQTANHGKSPSCLKSTSAPNTYRTASIRRKVCGRFLFFFFLSLVSRSRLIEKEMSEKARIIQDLKLLGASSATVDATTPETGNPRIQEFPEGHAPAADRPSSLHHTQSQRAPQHHQNHHQRSVPPVLLDYETSPGRGSTDDVLMRDAQQRFLLPMEGSPSDWRRPS